MATYRRPQFFLTSQGNLTTLAEMITFYVAGFPAIPPMFGLIGGTVQYVLQQLQQQYSRVKQWCGGEAAILSYALSQLPTTSYRASGSPKFLLRGDGRGETYFCNQFSDRWGLSIDDCIARYFMTNSLIQSTTSCFFDCVCLRSMYVCSQNVLVVDHRQICDYPLCGHRLLLHSAKSRTFALEFQRKCERFLDESVPSRMAVPCIVTLSGFVAFD